MGPPGQGKDAVEGPVSVEPKGGDAPGNAPDEDEGGLIRADLCQGGGRREYFGGTSSRYAGIERDWYRWYIASLLSSVGL